MAIKFPQDFVWGAATAAHQVEGQNFNNDWWAWEQIPGHIKNGDSSAVANDWWNGRYVEDMDRAADLGLHSLRLSLEWSRIEPEPGRFSAEAVARYRTVLEGLKSRGLVPLVTLHHFTNPLWLASDGGWENPATVQRFSRFARFAVREFGDLVNFWATINEPNVYAYLGFVEGSWPPGRAEYLPFARVMINMMRAHAGAYYAIKDVTPRARVGLAHHFRPFAASDPNSPLDRAVAFARDLIFNRLFLEAVEEGRIRIGSFAQNLSEVKGTEDYIGVNYYYLDRVRFHPTRPGDLFAESILDSYELELQSVFTTVGSIEPNAFQRTLEHLAVYGKPVYITENGVFDDGRNLQSEYMVSHLAAVRRAIDSGADVRGYFWWTLIDNFEWAEGYSARFGLYRLSQQDQRRTIRSAGETYSRIIRENGIADELMETNGRSK